MKNKIKSKVMTIANHLVKLGASRSAAMLQAWLTVKLHRIETKTAGVTKDRRQNLLERLNRYAPEDITIKLQRESGNPFDADAVQIVAAVKGKGSAVMGYLNRQLAAVVAPLMDKGKEINTMFKAVTGGSERYLNYGLNIELAM